MTPRQATALREQRYRELIAERYGDLNDLEAERDGPTPQHRRRTAREQQADDYLNRKEASS